MSAEDGPSPARFSVRQPVLVNLASVAVVIVGLYVLAGMTREVYPIVPVGGASITTRMPGASPQEIEQLVTAPIEDELGDIEDVDVMESTSSEGLSFIWVEFEPSVTDTARKVLELTNEVNRVATLPAGAEAPVVREAAVRPPMLSVAIRGQAPEAVLRSVAREVADRLARIDGIAGTEPTGIREREIQVDVDPDRLAAHGVPLETVSSALSLRGSNVPAGQMETGRRSRVVRGIAQASTALAVGDVVVRTSPEGGAVRVRDVADVREGFARARTLARVDGEPAIVLILRKEDGADALRTSERVHATIEQMRPSLPPGVEVRVFGDTAPWVRGNLLTLYSNAAMGLVLVLAILWVFIGLRNGLMAAIGIPVALAGGLIVMDALGITLNLLSLLALTLCVGIVVDDAIVILENVHRHVENGLPRRRAAIVGTLEVIWPVAASVATTCAAFLPLLMMTGVLGKFFAIIPKVVVATLVASLIEAFFVLPGHIADFGASASRAGPQERAGALARIGRAVERGYLATLRWALGRRWLVLVGAYALCIGMIGAALALKDVVLFTEGDVEMFDVRVRMPTDAAPEETDRVLRQIEQRVLSSDSPDVEAVITTRGYSRTRTWNATGDHVGMVSVFMVPREERTSQGAGNVLMERSARMFDDVVGPASIEVVKFEDGPPRGAPVAVRIAGEDLDELAELAERVQAALQGIPGTRDVADDHELGKREVRVHVDEERAALHGLTTGAVASWLATVFGAAPAATTREGDEEVDVVVRVAESARRDPERLGELTLATPGGASVALREIATIEPGRGLARIERRDRRRVITVTAELVEGSGATSTGVNEALERRIAPLRAANPDVRFELGGEYEETNESLRSLFFAFIVAALLIYTILATQFRSFVQPMIVMTAIPLSMIGVSLGFFVSGEAVGLIGLIGVVGLAGIVVNDSLVLVDFINVRRRAGMPLSDAVLEAGRLRLRPIVLTSVTTIAGLFPLALGIGGRSELLAPMATAISWGLTFSTVLILVVVPCLYVTIDGLAGTLRRLLSPLARAAAGAEEPADGAAP